MSTDPLAEDVEVHVPTTDEVRVNMVADLNGSDPLTAERLGQFDRWLAAHDAQVRADERQKIAALLADEHTVEKVADAVRRAWTPRPADFAGDTARAVLDVIAGLIGGEDE